MRNRLSIPVTALALLALAACGTESPAGSAGGGSVAPDVPLSGVRWSVDSLTVDGKRSAAPEGAHVEITDEGRAEGSYGCNQFGADVTVKGDTVTVGESRMTEKACEGEVQGFEDALRGALTGELKAKLTDGRLTLTTGEGDTIALSAEKPAPLKGTKWTVDSLVDGTTAASVPEGTENKAHLTIAEDGTVGGSLGCNRFSSTAEVKGDTITFGRIAATRKLCPGPEMDLERQLTALLESGPVTYEVEDRSLTLTAENGKGVVARAAAS